MVFGRRLAVTSFFVCCWVFVLWLVLVLCFGCASFCFAVVAFVAVFFSSLDGCAWLASLGFFFCWGLVCGVCFLLGVWLMLSFVGCWCVGFVVFRGFLVWLAFAFSVLLPFLPSYPTFAWFGDFGFWPTAAFCLLLSVSSLRCSGVLFPADVWLRSSVFIGRVGLFVAVWATMAGHSCGT